MSSPKQEKRESRAERTDRIARGILSEEHARRDKKTARLREMRLKTERMAAA